MDMTSTRLAEIMDASGYTASEVATAVGVTRQAVYFWRAGRSVPGGTSLLRLAKFLRVKPADLLPERKAA